MPEPASQVIIRAVFRIDFLADFPECISALAPPLLDHWSYVFPEDTLDTRVAKLRRHLNRDALPIAWLAHEGGQTVGTAALRVHDLEGREDLSPWLGGVFVLPAFRRQGIGSALCAAVEQHARRTGVGTLYLFTIDQQALYADLGWEILEHTVWHGFESDIMKKRL